MKPLTPLSHRSSSPGALATPALGQAPKPVTLLNVSYDPTRELYEDFNTAVRRLLEGQDRPGRHHPPVARRLGQAGPLGDRRARGRRGDAGAGLRHRPDRREGRARCRPTGSPGCPTTARPTPRRSCSWSGRAIRRASRTGAIWPSRASRSSRPTRRPRAARAGTTWPPGPGRCVSPAATTPSAKDFVDQALQERAGARRRRPRLHDHLRGARHRRRAARLGERGAAGHQGAGPRQVRDRGPVAQHPGRAAGRRGGQGRRQARHQGGGAGLPRVPVHRGRAGDRGPALLPPAARRGRGASTRPSSPR